MLFRTLAKELEESQATVVELVSHAFIRNRTTQPQSSFPGEALGDYVAHLISNVPRDKIHGKSLHLRSLKQLKEVGLDTERYANSNQ